MDRKTRTYLDNIAREKILKGVAAVYEPVRRTLGPAGANGLLPRTYNRGPRITNDGHTLAHIVEPKDEAESLVANAFREAVKRTNELAGDGKTTTAVIAGVLIKDVFERLQTSAFAVTKGSNVMDLRKQMLEEVEVVKARIEGRAKKVESLEDLIKIATVFVEDPIEMIGRRL